MEQQQFARALANPDKAVRDRTVRELKKYLAGVSSFEDVEMLKLWKALFYCLWLSDKAPIQEELCNSIASMMEVFQKPSLSYGKYLKSFFRIMLMEWDQLDQHRINKFYTLIRVMLRKTFELLHSVHWAEKTAHRFLEAVTVEVLMKRPNGPRYHLCDIYLTELWNATEGQISHDNFMVAISPFFSALGTTDDPMFRARLIEKVFQDFVDNFARENRQSDFDLKLFDQVSTLALQREVFDVAASPSEEICSDRNRRKVYDLHGVLGRFSGVKNVSDEECDADLANIAAERANMSGTAKSVNIEKKEKKEKKLKKEKTQKKKEAVPEVEQEEAEEEEKKEKKEKKEKNRDKKRARDEGEGEEEPAQTPATPLPPTAFVASKKYTGAKPGYSFQRVSGPENENECASWSL
jgi:ribosomal RNA-processing protein 1